MKVKAKHDMENDRDINDKEKYCNENDKMNKNNTEDNTNKTTFTIDIANILKNTQITSVHKME